MHDFIHITEDGVLTRYTGDEAELALPEGLIRIEAEAFRDNESLRAVTLPRSLKEIGANAFSGCLNLSHVNFSEGSALVSIEDGAFAFCDFDSFSLPEGLSHLGKKVFLSCDALERIRIPEGIKELGDALFKNCSALEEISLPRGALRRIGAEAFEDCYLLRALSLPDGVEQIGARAFRGCFRLATLSLPQGLCAIGEDAFDLCGVLDELTLPMGGRFVMREGCLIDQREGRVLLLTNHARIPRDAGIRVIASSAASARKGITSLTVPEGVERIENRAFAGCDALYEILLPDTLTHIGECAFLYCSALKEIRLPDGITAIEQGTFHSCTALTALHFPTGLLHIGKNAFRICASLTRVSLPPSVLTVGESAFEFCENLFSFALSNPDTAVADDVCRWCDRLAVLTLPSCAREPFWLREKKEALCLGYLAHPDWHTDAAAAHRRRYAASHKAELLRHVKKHRVDPLSFAERLFAALQPDTDERVLWASAARGEGMEALADRLLPSES